MRHPFAWLLGLLLALASGLDAQEVDFQREIRPLLSDRCFKCHGFDEETQEADLGLHTFAAATRDLGGYQAIKPGDSAASELIERIISDDPEEVMPPAKANKPRFSPEEVALMKRWIDQGAKYEEHWSFKKPVRPEVPAAGESKSAHPVDRFLDAKRAGKELPLNGSADAHTLIRRLSYDLRGLPPMIAETDAFVAEHAKNPEAAWSALVDRFLASPAYGERWARDWLDLARYSDTNGYEKDRPRSMWPYRDWVVRAFNQDLPYDRFTIEQLAGDLLPNATADQLIATGFHRNTMLNEEGGIDPLEFRYLAMIDRVATTGSVWMGLTTGCAQCHTHKFDPITHTDFYSLMALLNNADEPEIEIVEPALTKQRQEIEQQIAALETKAIAAIDEAKYQAWLSDLKTKAAPWTVLPPLKAKANLPLLEIEKDHAIYASGDFTKRDVYEVSLDLAPLAGKAITALRLEALPDPRLPANGPGAAYYEGRKGDFFLSEVAAMADGEKLAFSGASVSFGKISIGSGEAKGENLYDGDGSTGWSTASREGEAHALVLNLARPLTGAKTLDLTLLFERHFVAGLGKFRLSATTAGGTVVALPSGTPDVQTSDDATLRRAFVRIDPAHKAVQDEIAELRKQIPEPTTTLVMKERPSNNPRPTHRHHRGEYLSPKEAVAPAVPAYFEPIPEGTPANRLGLAKWLVSDRNPLGARVMVNRTWQAFFGRGIVHTAGDYGYQSELPSHPELLDWLAAEFVAQGWSVKKLHRLLVTSAAYQRDSRIDSIQLEKDPDNVLLARGPRFRLTGEMLRDGALAASGLLSPKMGGPSVYPPQPGSVVELAYGNDAWKTSGGEDRYRRSLYTFSKRTAPFAAYLTFDGPTGENCLPRRDRSNTPLQALTLMNDPMFHEAAEGLARLTGSGGGTRPSQVHFPAGPDKNTKRGGGEGIPRLLRNAAGPSRLGRVEGRGDPFTRQGPRHPRTRRLGDGGARPPQSERKHHPRLIMNESLRSLTRRHFFHDCGLGLGRIGLASAFAGGFANLAREANAALVNPLAPRDTHHGPRAKRVIFLFMAGAPSQLELFDDKPKLRELDGKPIPPSVIAGQRYAFIQPDAAVLAPRFPFAKHGQCGAELSDRLPYLAKIVDDIAIVKSLKTDQFNHAPAQLFLNTGHGLPGRPAMGSWLSYGIGSEADDLPSFVVLKSGGSLSGGAAMWSAGFLPGSHAGVPFRDAGDPILHVSNPKGYDARAQRDSLDLIRKMNEREFGAIGDPEIQTRIDAYEMAWRMQSAAPELMDFSDESPATIALYGAKPGDPKAAFANQCLLARRLVERGTRFVQVYHSGWDHHSQVENGVKAQAKEVDQASAALVMDLKQRGLLEDTLVVWGGEFGRTPMVEASAALGRSLGRDHHPQAFTMWMAGGGIKPGITLGATDELGFHVVEDPVHIHDLHATLLHLLGIEHTKLTFRYQGRDYRLTDVHGHLVEKLLA